MIRQGNIEFIINFMITFNNNIKLKQNNFQNTIGNYKVFFFTKTVIIHRALKTENLIRI